MDVAFIGLGKMGASMGARLLAAGHVAHGYDRDADRRRAFVERGGRALDSVAQLGDRLPSPRVVWLMVPAGETVDAVLAELEPVLTSGDIVVDGGNSHYKDTLRRAARLQKSGLQFVDAGTSGGIWGLENGYCLMVGGSDAAVTRLRPILEALAPGKDRGWGHVGPPGAGHFVKMIHNGIEYGMMQAYAEGFALLGKKKDLELDPAAIAEIWRHGSVIRSWLLDLTAQALREEPGLESVEPWVADSGEGRWTVAEAIDLDTPAPVLTLALIERLASREKDSLAHKILAVMRARFGGHPLRRKHS